MSQAPIVRRFPVNTAGKDYAVGDIHGHFTLLQAALDEVGFNPEVDRLFSVGDLVDRGPECDQAVAWLAKPFFHAARGNHDDYVCRHDSCQIGQWLVNGGLWWSGLLPAEQAEFATWFRDLPIAIQVETPEGLVGLVHAECPYESWPLLLERLETQEGGRLRDLRNACMWSRKRIENQDESVIEGVRVVVVGHTPVERPVMLGNVLHIDTAGWCPQAGGFFTLLDLQSLTAFCCVPDSERREGHE